MKKSCGLDKLDLAAVLPPLGCLRLQRPIHSRFWSDSSDSSDSGRNQRGIPPRFTPDSLPILV